MRRVASPAGERGDLGEQRLGVVVARPEALEVEHAEAAELAEHDRGRRADDGVHRRTRGSGCRTGTRRSTRRSRHPRGRACAARARPRCRRRRRRGGRACARPISISMLTVSAYRAASARPPGLPHRHRHLSPRRSIRQPLTRGSRAPRRHRPSRRGRRILRHSARPGEIACARFEGLGRGHHGSSMRGAASRTIWMLTGKHSSKSSVMPASVPYSSVMRSPIRVLRACRPQEGPRPPPGQSRVVAQ